MSEPLASHGLGRPLVVGIAGGTGSGKTTVAHKLAASMPGRCATIEHDAYYRDQSHLSPMERAVINYDHPASLESDLLAELQFRKDTSRLSCQVRLTDALNGLSVSLAPEE